MNAQQIISLWPSPQAFAADIGEQVGTVYVWRHREQLPERVTARVYAAARARGLAVEIDSAGRLVGASA